MIYAYAQHLLEKNKNIFEAILKDKSLVLYQLFAVRHSTCPDDNSPLKISFTLLWYAVR